jgi:hypothetical protein
MRNRAHGAARRRGMRNRAHGAARRRANVQPAARWPAWPLAHRRICHRARRGAGAMARTANGRRANKLGGDLEILWRFQPTPAIQHSETTLKARHHPCAKESERQGHQWREQHISDVSRSKFGIQAAYNLPLVLLFWRGRRVLASKRTRQLLQSSTARPQATVGTNLCASSQRPTRRDQRGKQLLTLSIRLETIPCGTERSHAPMRTKAPRRSLEKPSLPPCVTHRPDER